MGLELHLLLGRERALFGISCCEGTLADHDAAVQADAGVDAGFGVKKDTANWVYAMKARAKDMMSGAIAA